MLTADRLGSDRVESRHQVFSSIGLVRPSPSRAGVARFAEGSMNARVVLPLAWVAVTVFMTSSGLAAVPSSGTLSPDNPVLSYTGGPYTASNGSGAAGPVDCDLVPNSCDDFMLTVDVPLSHINAYPGTLVQIVVDWPGPSDFDLSLQDPSTGDALRTSGNIAGEAEVINFYPTPGVTTYRLRAVAFAAINETITGTIRLLDAPPTDTALASYAPSHDVFTCNTHLTGQSNVFDHGGDGEPSVAFDGDGNTWITGIAGLGGGIGLWKIAASDVCAQSPTFLDSPDAGAGGGDTDIAIASERNALGNFNIYTSSLSLANVTSSTSVDGGATFVLTPFSNESAAEDRQWNAAYGVNTLYLSFNVGATQPGQVLEFFRSSAAGAGGSFEGPFYPRGATVDPAIHYGLGNMAVDRRAGGNEVTLTAGADGEGNVYQGYHQNENEVWVAVSRDFGTTWSQSKVYQGPPGTSVDHKFTWVAVDGGGNVYTCWCDDQNVYYSVSQNLKTTNAATWSLARRVNDGPMTRTCALPMMEAGSAGRLIFGWYGTSAYNNITPGASYNYFHARCNNALDAVPLFEQAKVSDHVVHTGAVCQDGLACSCCRELLELQELAVNPLDGSTLFTYAGAAGIHVGREVAGTSAIAGKTVADQSNACPTLANNCVPPPVVGPSPCILPGITVVTDGPDSPPVANAQQDIQTVSVAEPAGSPYANGSVLVWTMKVAELQSGNLPPNAFWRMRWTGSDGDHYVSMINCATGGVTYEYGHFSGTGNVSDGAADHGEFFADGTIRITIDRTHVGNPTPGTILTNIQCDTRDIVGDCPPNVGAVYPPIDTFTPTAANRYTVVGNDYCTPHAVECAADFSGGAGDHPASFLIHNPSSASRTFLVVLSDDHHWLVGGTLVGPAGPVSPGSSLSIPVTIRFPDGCQATTDQIHFQAVAPDLPSPDSEQQCTTAAACSGLTAVDPLGNRLAFRVSGASPFCTRTEVSYSLPERSAVRVEVFSVAGQRVRTLVNEMQSAGNHTARFVLTAPGERALHAGVYIIRLTAGNATRTVRVIGLN
jgi:hypothetical protein